MKKINFFKIPILFATLCLFSIGILLPAMGAEKLETSLPEDRAQAVQILPEGEGQAVSPTGTGDSGLKFKTWRDIDTKGISLSKEVEARITASDRTGAEKNLHSYKRALVEFGVPEDLQMKMVSKLDQGFDIPDILTAYELLYKSYGTWSQLEEVLDGNKKGERWDRLINQYEGESGGFIPTTFPPGYLEALMEDRSITADDVMMADRIAQNEKIKLGGENTGEMERFEYVMGLKKQGNRWKDIKQSLGMINREESTPRISITAEEAGEYLKDETLTQDQVVDALVTAKVCGLQPREVIEKTKAGVSQAAITRQYYDEKYR